MNKSLSPRKKPPLLPKPQLATTDLKNGKHSPIRKIQNSSQTVISVKNAVRGADAASQQLHEREETIILNNINIADSAARGDGRGFGRIGEKPPALYPKPKLPPKSNAFRTAKSVQGSPCSGENSPGKPFAAPNHTPVRPPRSPKKVFKDNPLEEFQNRALCQKTDSPLGFTEQRQKSASLTRSEFVNWSSWRVNHDVKFSTDASAASSEKSSPVLPPTPRPRSKNKSKFHLELDLATPPEVQCPVYATVDYTKKRNRQNNVGLSTKFVGDEPRLNKEGAFRR